jgi:hypothetical protein
MTIVTIESVSAASKRELVKILSMKKGFVVHDVEISYEDHSSIFSSIKTFVTSYNDSSFNVFPLSFYELSKSDLYPLVVDLLHTLGFDTTKKHIAIRIDGNANDALAESFEHPEHDLRTLEEIRVFRDQIMSNAYDDTLAKPRFIHTTEIHDVEHRLNPVFVV